MSIKVNNLTFKYMVGTPFEKTALDNVSFEIKDGEFIGLIGHTGSGKSTLIQHLNGLLKPTSGEIYIDDECITAKGVDLKRIRQLVGLVFQYPEHQLFEETVFKDVSYGPKNLGLDEEEIESRVKWALSIVGIDYDKYKDVSPFDLSGGQKRRVAIAGVLAMQPKVLILDEPTAGLDPKGRDEILQNIKNLHKKSKMTIILVSHSMDDVAELADKLIVMYRGKNIIQGTPKEVFRNVETLESIGLAVPQVKYLVQSLNKKGFNLNEDIITVSEAKDAILKALRREKK
ncbi:energy-coupling factor transporter ATPase [Caloramator proteoclasticus]|uniref:Energy-coupling factor transporter ATP-binding protein EcfA2 n=1 Tax=Caloramator proteoclasticus DSM 10124 TaxID=1121262 RepID=A0A1M4VSJ6_9CLOT|nr:energy-coupling factor transporter ATPase [Caloramator proteoclasticus]SHE71898.1 energy-coupling factor transport system ATP-binding protein [Caloramator proteoclasticus DSM 10124]